MFLWVFRLRLTRASREKSFNPIIWQCSEKPVSQDWSKMARCKAPASLSSAVQAGNPESGVATNQERLLATPPMAVFQQSRF